jgi:hypothetical protein
MSITKVSDFNIENVSVSEVKKNKSGGEAAYLKYDNNTLILQTDILNLVSSEEKFLELNCDGTKFMNIITLLEQLAESTFRSEEHNLRSVISDDYSIRLAVVENQTMMFDSKKNSTDCIESENNVQVLVQPAGIWCKNQEYGVSFKLLQVKVLEKEESLQDYAFVDDDNDYYDVIPNDF